MSERGYGRGFTRARGKGEKRVCGLSAEMTPHTHTHAQWQSTPLIHDVESRSRNRYSKGLNAETPALRREHQSLVGSSSTLWGRPPRLGIVG
ncbi:hypothetical protein J6590_034387 [Homalodisca vitripennis]|nr:hypothetical protein J6590_034387 [Homalodisca vitripennis]